MVRAAGYARPGMLLEVGACDREQTELLKQAGKQHSLTFAGTLLPGRVWQKRVLRSLSCAGMQTCLGSERG